MPSLDRAVRAAKAFLTAAVCLSAVPGCAPRMVVQSAPERTVAEAELQPSADRALALVRNGEFDRAARVLSSLPLDSSTRVMAAQGIVDIARNRPKLAETELRQVFESRIDTSVRRLAYKGLQSIYTRQERYAALESLENRALPEGLCTDTTDWLSARVLRGIGPARIEPAQPMASVAIRLSPSGTPLLPVRINGRPPVDLWFDTGASMSVISEELARRFGVRPFGTDTGYAGAAVRRKVMFRFAVIDSLQIDEITVRNLPVLVMRRRDLSLGIPGLRLDGVIGWSLISRFRTVIDYPARRIALQAPVDAAPGTPNLVLFGSVPLVRVQVDSTGPLNFILDTGAQISLLQETGLARLQPAPSLATVPGCIGGAGGGGVRNLRLVPAARVSVAGQAVYPVALAVYTLPLPEMSIALDGLLGGDVLRNFMVTIDAANCRLSLN